MDLVRYIAYLLRIAPCPAAAGPLWRWRPGDYTASVYRRFIRSTTPLVFILRRTVQAPGASGVSYGAAVSSLTQLVCLADAYRSKALSFCTTLPCLVNSSGAAGLPAPLVAGRWRSLKARLPRRTHHWRVSPMPAAVGQCTVGKYALV